MSDGSGDASGLGEDNACVLYARIGTLETDIPEDLTDYWAEPVSYFLVQGEWGVSAHSTTHPIQHQQQLGELI